MAVGPGAIALAGVNASNNVLALSHG